MLLQNVFFFPTTGFLYDYDLLIHCLYDSANKQKQHKELSCGKEANCQ